MPPSQPRPPRSGFELLTSSPFLAHLGAVFVDRTGARPRFIAEVQAHHANTMGDAHGGFLMALADIATGQGVRAILGDGRQLRTTSTTVDFLSRAAVGDWVEADVTVDRAGRQVVFASCRLSVGDRSVARASVVLSVAGESTSTPG